MSLRLMDTLPNTCDSESPSSGVLPVETFTGRLKAFSSSFSSVDSQWLEKTNSESVAMALLQAEVMLSAAG